MVSVMAIAVVGAGALYLGTWTLMVLVPQRLQVSVPSTVPIMALETL